MIKLHTHDDLDAVGCVVLAKLAYPDQVTYDLCDHKQINDAVKKHFDLNTEDECHITDIAVSKELADIIDESGRTYWLFDHHQTALDMNEYDWCEVRIDNASGIKTCGTEIYYEWLVARGNLQRTETLDRFVQIIRDYDTWRWSTMGDDGIISKQVNDLYYIYKDVYGVEAFINWAIFCINHNSFPHFHDCENVMLTMKQKEIDAYVEEKNEQLFIAECFGYQCGFVFADKHFSELGNRICKMRPEIDLIAMVDVGKRAISYRTVKDDVHVGEIARSMGGGGHQKAAGSAMNAYTIDILRVIFYNRMD